MLGNMSSPGQLNQPEALAALLARGVRLSQAAAAFGLDVDTAASEAVGCAVGLHRLPPPAELTCPITTDLFRDPVVASDTFTYERSAFEEHLRSKKTSPTTNSALAACGTMPAGAVASSQTVRGLVVDWLEDRSVIATYALQRSIESGNVEEAQEYLLTHDPWVERFPVKRLLTFRQVALRIPLYGDCFKAREAAFMTTAAAAGLDTMTAFLKHHELSFGGCRYGYYGPGYGGGETWTLRSDSLVITTLLPACSSSWSFRTAFTFDAVATSKTVLQHHSHDFDIQGLGTCYVKLFSEDEAVRARLCVRRAAPSDKLEPLLVSLRRVDSKTTFYWRERGRKAHDDAYDVRVHEMEALGEGACTVVLEVVARSLSGAAVDVPVKPPGDDVCGPAPPSCAAAGSEAADLSPRILGV